MEIPATEKERKALKVGDIRVLLEGAGIDAKGTKPTLLERLEELVETRASAKAPDAVAASGQSTDAAVSPIIEVPSVETENVSPRTEAPTSASADVSPAAEVPAVETETPTFPAVTTITETETPALPAVTTETETETPALAATKETETGTPGLPATEITVETVEVPPPPAPTTVVTTEVPPPPPLATETKNPEEKDEVQTETTDTDGGEHDVLVTPADAPLVAQLLHKHLLQKNHPIHTTQLTGGSTPAAVLTFRTETAAAAAVAKMRDDATARKDATTVELRRKTLWPDERVLFDPKKTSVLVKNVPPGINQDAMRHVFGTYGLVHHVEMPAVYADGTWATETCVVTMSNREGAETASAALSGVYRFEETQLLPVALAWCGQDPDVDAEHQSGIGEKRKREDEDVIEAVTRHKGVVSGHQLAVVGVPMGATETDIAAYFGHECQLDKDVFVLMFHDTRTAFVSFADANKAQHAMETFGKHGTLRPNGSAIPVTLRWLVVSLQERKAPAKRAAPPPAGVWPPVPRPGPQYGEPSPKLYVGSIPAQYGDDEIRAVFSTVGVIKDVKILRRNDGSHKGSGFVQFHDVPSAERAIHFIDGKYVLNAPGFPQQRPVYMKFASVGGGGLGSVHGGGNQGARAHAAHGRHGGQQTAGGYGNGGFGGGGMGGMGGQHGQVYGQYAQQQYAQTQQAYGQTQTQAYGQQAAPYHGLGAPYQQHAAAYQAYYAGGGYAVPGAAQPQQGAPYGAQPGVAPAYGTQSQTQPPGGYAQWPPQQ